MKTAILFALYQILFNSLGTAQVVHNRSGLEFTNRADFTGGFNYSITHADFSKSTFPRGFEINKTVCQSGFDFTLIKADSTVVVKNCNFNKQVIFEQASFLRNVTIAHNLFKNKVSFRYSNYLNTSIFWLNEFQQHVDFHYAIFFRDAVFSETVFKGGSDFSKVTFHKEAVFESTKFGHVADFSFAVFVGELDMRMANFEQKLDFTASKFENYAYFHNMSLPDTLVLQDVKDIFDQLDFSLIENNPKRRKAPACKLNLWGADLKKIILDYSHFELYFPEDLGTTPEQQQKLVMELHQNQHANGFEKGYQKLEKDFKIFLAGNEK